MYHRMSFVLIQGFYFSGRDHLMIMAVTFQRVSLSEPCNYTFISLSCPKITSKFSLLSSLPSTGDNCIQYFLEICSVLHKVQYLAAQFAVDYLVNEWRYDFLDLFLNIEKFNLFT